MSQQYPPPNPPPASGATLAPTMGATAPPATGTTAPPATGATPGPQTLSSAAPPDYGDIYKKQQQPPPQQPPPQQPPPQQPPPQQPPPQQPPRQQPAQGFPVQPQGYAVQPQGYAVQPQGFPVQPQGFPVQHQGFPVQPQFAYMQQPTMQPAMQQVPYMMPAQMQMVAVTPRPNYPGPHDFLILTVVVTIICAFLNITSLVFGMTALVLAITSKSHKDGANYPSAKKYGSAALAFTICNIAYTLCCAILGIGLALGLWYRNWCTYLHYSSYNGYYCRIY